MLSEKNVQESILYISRLCVCSLSKAVTKLSVSSKDSIIFFHIKYEIV